MQEHELGDLAERAARQLGVLNGRVRELLDEDRLIGHTYLMRDDLREVGFETVWEEDIEPVLREHLFSQPEEIINLRDLFLRPS